MNKILLSLVSLAMLNSCSITRATPAPVLNVTAPTHSLNSAPMAAPSLGNQVTPSLTPSAEVGQGTTLNKINSDEDGQLVQSSTKPANKPKLAPAALAPTEASGTLGGVAWLVPTEGKIIQAYTSTTKGVDVAGKEGQAIVAAAAGKVVYSGSGLKGYGNLIILKHQDNYLTAYSHNKVNLVKEGQLVKRGQKIAELGKSDSDKPILHFELRQNGKPLNPSKIFNQ